MYACGVPGPEWRSVPRGEVSQQCGWGFHGEILWGKLAGKGRYDRDGSPGRNRSSGRVPARRSPAETPRAAAPRTTPSPCLLPGAARRARPAPLLPATPPARSPQSGVPCCAVPCPPVGPSPTARSPSAPGSMRRGPPGPVPPGPEPRDGRALGSPGGARAARRLRRRGGAPRLLPDVRNIFAAPREAAERGRGHRFVPRAPRRGWCDLCGAAVRERALRCDCECCRPAVPVCRPAVLPRTASRTASRTLPSSPPAPLRASRSQPRVPSPSRPRGVRGRAGEGGVEVFPGRWDYRLIGQEGLVVVTPCGGAKSFHK